MNLSIRHWLAERNLTLARLKWVAGAQMAGIAFRIAQDLEFKSLSLFEVAVLAEIFELPIAIAWPELSPLAELMGCLLRVLSQKKPLKRNEGTWLVFQIAYLNGLDRLLQQETLVRRPWINRAMLPTDELQNNIALNQPQLPDLLQTLRPGHLSDTQAEQALSQWSASLLVQQINQTASAWLMANGAEEIESQLLIGRLSHGLPGELLEAIALHSSALPQLQKFVRLGTVASWSESLHESDDYELLEVSPPPTPTLGPMPIDLARERYRAGFNIALSQPMFEECFSLNDIHVPLKGVVYDGTLGSNPPPVDLMEWAKTQLSDLSSIAVVEGLPGQGKSSFCQMWAAKVASEFYPSWMPVLIRLRDVTLGTTLEQTLLSALPLGNFTCADGWLSPVHSPCLLVFDGLDELPRSPLAEDQIWLLMDQIVRFQSQYAGPTGLPRHKVFITCRNGTLSRAGIETLHISSTHSQTPLLSHLRRIAIAPMGQDEVKQWFKHWSRLQTKNIAQAYFNFLKQGGLFRPTPPTKELANLVRQPLMLYFLGILHRDGLLHESVFQMPYPQVKFEIYDRLLTWLLGKPTAGLSVSGRLETPGRVGLAHAGRRTEAIANLLKTRQPHQIRAAMQTTALSILQSGRATIHYDALQSYLGDEPTLAAFCFRFEEVQTDTSKFQQTFQRVGFAHRSLGEYLCAEEIASQLKALAHIVRDPYGELKFATDDKSAIAQHLYNLLGYGILPLEMEDLIAERLWREEARDEEAFRFRTLFARLHRFYRSYCRGRWMDEGIAHKARQHLQQFNNSLNVLQIDAAVGLNTFLLLCACRREANLPFWPCGNATPKRSKQNAPPEALSAEEPMEFNPSQLLALAGRTAVLSPNSFWLRVRYSLKSIQLSGTYLYRALLAGGNLQAADLSASVLVEANLVGANLKEANLSWANLTGANLTGANLTGANLEGANLMGANLQRCNLQSTQLNNACLVETQMDESSWDIARAKGAFFSWEQYQAYSQAIATQSIKEEPTTDSSGDDATSVLPIEMAEDEPVAVPSSSTLSEEDIDAETVVYRPPLSDETRALE
ncbi:pentapeptide repeat-containing protein [Desertifilum sp. FACHB-866]|uniref:Uncharacterized protein n=2 Tax=Desertifilaceae TaxID=1969992 RepID=A0A1E5QRG2_9CYAN|nr:pentapeptide repeat-containing protein [Desertifilum sp. FACHB-866]OEJ77221.1 hypothetical protein BH720_00670 [Desertifilum tharense IPPAS B-1220]